MKNPFTHFKSTLALALLIAAPLSVGSAFSADPIEPEDYDRLDGHGLSQKKVDVIEWEGNLEIHVYPKGSLRGLGLKIDRTDKKKPVMVIAYRFNNVPYTLYRRAVLAVPLSDQFKVYEETTADDYDKIMITNNTLTSNVRPFQLDAPPKQLYPDHHPALQQGASVGTTQSAQPVTPSSSNYKGSRVRLESESPRQADPDQPRFRGVKKSNQGNRGLSQDHDGVSDDGAIRSFSY